MDVFRCPGCTQLVFFANTACVRCGRLLAFDPERRTMVARDDSTPACINAEVAACNWLPVPGGDGRCCSCALTRTRPADGDERWLQRFRVAETAKRRLVFQLLALGLPVEPRDETTGRGVAFDLLASDQSPVVTGHAGGVITLDLAESDAVHRERVRTKLSEPYRTVLGHFRHEIGHYLFTVLVDDTQLETVRAAFGDERRDYAAALDAHYQQGAPEDWMDGFVSSYATMHPAEDFAETLAHYLHLAGVLGSSAAYRLVVHGPDPAETTDLDVELPALTADPARLLRTLADAPHPVDDPQRAREELIGIVDVWLPLTYALNAVNRSMGEDDLYPFVLSPAVIEKLAVVHHLVRRTGRGWRPGV